MDPIGDIKLFLTFFDNPVVVTAVIIVWMIYFFLIHWARQADKKDTEKVNFIIFISLFYQILQDCFCFILLWKMVMSVSVYLFFQTIKTGPHKNSFKVCMYTVILQNRT